MSALPISSEDEKSFDANTELQALEMEIEQLEEELKGALAEAGMAVDISSQEKLEELAKDLEKKIDKLEETESAAGERGDDDGSNEGSSGPPNTNKYDLFNLTKELMEEKEKIEAIKEEEIEGNESKKMNEGGGGSSY